MTIDKKMLVRLDPEVKRFVDAGAAQQGVSGNEFANRAFIHYLVHLGLKVEGRALRTCVHCLIHALARNNETNFCRKCQRTVGLPTLFELHPKENSHVKPKHASDRKQRR